MSPFGDRFSACPCRLTLRSDTGTLAGYSSTQSISVPGFAQLKVVVTLAYGADFKKNGSVSALALDSGKGK